MLSLLSMISIVSAKEIVLSAGLKDFTDQQLAEQYQRYENYLPFITASSILVYEIGLNGTLQHYNISSKEYTAETYQQSLKKNLGLKSYPCIFCDSTLNGICDNIDLRLNNVLKRKEEFILESIGLAKKYEYDGYYLDLEGVTNVDQYLLTDFVNQWATAIAPYHLKLRVWIGPGTPFLLEKLLENCYTEIASFDTYTDDYQTFVNQASKYFNQICNKSHLSYGLLTYDTTLATKNTIHDIFEYITDIDVGSVTFWASTLPGHWLGTLKTFLSK